MASSLRERRWEEIDTLHKEIDRLLLRYSYLPPGPLRDTVTAQVDKHFEKIDKLNEPSFLERSSGQHLALIISVICVLSGIVLSSYALVSAGILTMGFALYMLGSSPERSEENIRRWEP